MYIGHIIRLLAAVKHEINVFCRSLTCLTKAIYVPGKMNKTKHHRVNLCHAVYWVLTEKSRKLNEWHIIIYLLVTLQSNVIPFSNLTVKWHLTDWHTFIIWIFVVPCFYHFCLTLSWHCLQLIRNVFCYITKCTQLHVG